MQWDEVESITEIGEEETWDLKVAHNHNFILDNGIIVHNSGKDQAIDVFEDILRAINHELGYGFINFHELTGTETPESLLDHYPVKKVKGKEEIDYERIVHGIFSQNDVIISRECSFLFVERRGERQTKSELLLTALEGRPITKTLRGWEGHSTITPCNFVFVGCSRPITNMKAHIAGSGLQQRAINYCRDVDFALRKKMSVVDTSIAFGSKMDLDVYQEEVRDLVKELLKLKDLAKNGEFFVEDEDTCNKLVSDAIMGLYSDISEELRKKEHQKILEGFVSRFTNVFLILSHQNALLRKYKVSDKSFKKIEVTASDVQMAIDFVTKTFVQLKDWVEEVIEEDKDVMMKRKGFERAVVGLFGKEFYKIEQSVLVKNLSVALNCSPQYVYKLLGENTGNDRLLKKIDESCYALNRKNVSRANRI